MPRKIAFVAALFFSLSALPHRLANSAAARVLAPQTADSLHQAARDALGEDASRAALGVRSLRAAGQAGLDAYFQTFDEIQAAAKNNQPLSATVQKNFRPLADRIAMQKDACFTRLYWYTDLATAQGEAQRTSKPILSLHLLGNLNEDLSCANSRFFRTTLYPNENVQKFLRDNFVLHWQSERPVPIVTIDFGDGRKITRTLTGNSIHYILDPHGRLVDALPGLYGPAAFIRNLDAAKTEAEKLAPLSDADYARALADFHSRQAQSIHDAFTADLARLHLSEATLTDDDWRKISSLHPIDAALDFNAVAAMRGKVPAIVAMRTTASKMVAEDPMMKMVRNVEGNIGIDTVKNQYLMHEQICKWLGHPLNPSIPPVLGDFNARVYAELFLTPKRDPWVGLALPDIYSAVDNGGLTEAAKSWPE
jgi:hypothetical protein